MLHDVLGNEPKGRVELHCHSTSLLETLESNPLGTWGSVPCFYVFFVLFCFLQIHKVCVALGQRPEQKQQQIQYDLSNSL